MASKFDESDFIDSDYQSAKSSYSEASPEQGTSADVTQRPPTREELESKVSETQKRMLELKRAQEELERERAGLEEARRRKLELHTGREEIVQNLARGVGLLEEAEFSSRRDAEQMAKTLADLRDALSKVQAIQEESWSQDNWSVELTRALTAIENARMEWNGARLKWALLNGASAAEADENAERNTIKSLWEGMSFLQLSKLGLAFTWPLVLIGVIGLGLTLIFVFR